MKEQSILEALANASPVLMDGAMGTEIARTGPDISSPDWVSSTLGQPEQISNIHKSYAVSGARLHIANTFATGRHVLSTAGLEDQFETLNRKAVWLCRNAIEEVSKEPQWIAGSVSTYVIGSDRSNLPAHAQLRHNVQEQAHILAEEGCDLIVLEMLFDVETSLVMLEAAREPGLPVSIGFTCTFDEDHDAALRGRFSIGQSQPIKLTSALPEFISQLSDTEDLIMTIMHSDLDVTHEALKIVHHHWSGLKGCYPNSGRMTKRGKWDHQETCPPAEFVEYASRWDDQGLNFIGGCCGIGPEHIAAFASSIKGA